MGDAVGKLYVARHFPPAAKAQIEEMVRQIAAAFDRRIEALDWMAPETKAQARAKVRSLTVSVGYPEHWVDYAGLEISRGDLLGNVQRASLFDYQPASSHARASRWTGASGAWSRRPSTR